MVTMSVFPLFGVVEDRKYYENHFNNVCTFLARCYVLILLEDNPEGSIIHESSRLETGLACSA